MGNGTPFVKGVYSFGASDLEWTVYGNDFTDVVVVLKLNGSAVNAHMFTPNSQTWSPNQMSLGDSNMSIAISTAEATGGQLGQLIVNNWTVTTKLDGTLTLSNVAIVSWDQNGKSPIDLFNFDDRPHPMVRTN